MHITVPLCSLCRLITIFSPRKIDFECRNVNFFLPERLTETKPFSIQKNKRAEAHGSWSIGDAYCVLRTHKLIQTEILFFREMKIKYADWRIN